MTMRVCALLTRPTTADKIAVDVVTHLRATLTEIYPRLAMPQDNIEFVNQILWGLQQHQDLVTINKLQTLKSGSLIEEH